MITDKINAMHKTFLEYAGGYTASRSLHFHERTWCNLCMAGFEVDDIDLYLRWITAQNAGRKEKYKRKLSILKMFSDADKFFNELSKAQAWQRNIVKPTAKEITLKALRPIIEEEVTHSVQSVKDITARIMRRIQKQNSRTDARGTTN